MSDDGLAPWTDPDNPFTLPGFFRALADGELYGIACSTCDRRLVPPRPACYGCGSREVALEVQPRSGTVVSYTEVVRAPGPFADQAPYTVAIVELDSGARLTGRVDASYDAVAIGDHVRLVVTDPDPSAAWVRPMEREWPIHRFEPVTD